MQDALRQGLLVIEEVSEGGSVDTIKATNKAATPVLLPDSEELVGAKQNRVLNVSILAVFAVNGEIVGVEAFDSPETFRKMFPKLLRSYALTAMTSLRSEARAIRVGEVDEFLNAVADAPAETFQPVGLGMETHLNDEQVNGCALLHEGRLIHLYAFRRPERRHTRAPELVGAF